jgi:hypothetical protein
MRSNSRIFAALFATLLPMLAAAQPTLNPGTVPVEPRTQSGSSGPATEVSGKTYFAVKLGGISPQHDDIRSYGTGFSVEGALGYRVNPNVALELSVGRFGLNATVSGDLGGVIATVTDDVVAYPVLATLKLLVPLDKLELFGLLGGGVYFISDEVKITAPGFAPLSGSDSASPFAFHLGGGANVRISPNAMVGAELKYIIGSATMYDVTNHFNSLIFAGTLTYTM